MGSDIFCFPWVGIMANIPKEDCFTKNVLNSLHENRTDAIRIRPVWTASGFTGYGLVEFGPEWYGFAAAMKFEADFEIDGKGRLDWYSQSDKVGLYGWLAMAPDFAGDGAVARNLHRLYDKKSFEDIMNEDRLRNLKLTAARKRDRAQAFTGYYADDESDDAVVPEKN